MSAARLLARGWYSGNKSWWRLSAGVLAFALVVLLVSSGLFAGMRGETESRVADFYVDDYRLTYGTGVVPADIISEDIQGQYPEANAQFESQLVLSRRGFVEQAVNEEEGFGIQTPGGSDKDLAIGVVIGVTDAPDIASHLVAGRMPTYQNGTVELVMSESRFHQFLSQEEANRISSPPRVNELRVVTFSITAARLEGGSLQSGGDLIRATAQVVGLYQTGVDVLDDFTYVAAIEDVRALHGHAADEPIANVLLLPTKPSATHGLYGQDAKVFNDQYLGQMLGAMQLVSTTSAVILFVLPTFLVMNGVLRQLQLQQREIAVSRAIGVPRKTVHSAIATLLLRMSSVAAIGTAVMVSVIGFILHLVLPHNDQAPVPMDFHMTLGALVGAIGVLVLSVAVGGWVAIRASNRQNVASALRV